jgi:hypothetical protein
MPDPDYRALCAELLVLAEESISYRAQVNEAVRLIDRARAALAQSEPEGPTDKELHQPWQELYGFHDGPTSGEANHVTTTTEINNRLELTASALQSCNKRLSSLLSLMRAERIQRKAL